jgi:hypothetical protein
MLYVYAFFCCFLLAKNTDESRRLAVWNCFVSPHALCEVFVCVMQRFNIYRVKILKYTRIWVKSNMNLWIWYSGDILWRS